jgi:hypothetical protein
MKAKFGGPAVDLRSKLETIEANNSYCFQSFGTYFFAIERAIREEEASGVPGCFLKQEH